MSFGSPTPIEVAVQGINLQDDYAFAQKVRARLAKLTFLRDLQFAQAMNFPTLDINIDRDRAGQFGLTMADVVRSVVPATSSSRFTQPNYWRDPNSGNAFQIQVELPQNRMQSVERSATCRSCRTAARNRARRHREPEARHHAGPDRALQRPARCQPDGEHSRHHAGRSGGETEPGDRGSGRPTERRLGRNARRDSRSGANPFRTAHRPAAGGAGHFSAAGGELPIRAAGAGDRSDGSRGAVRRAADAADSPEPR